MTHAVLSPVWSIECDGWPEEATLETLIEQSFQSVETELGLSHDHPSEVSLVFTDDETIRGINAEWRGKDKPTNVLSFPAFPLKPGQAPKPLLGDIVIALETVQREAVEERKLFDHHLIHMLVHGLLHLFGYDHETEEEAETMEALEGRILARLAIADPYALLSEDDV